YLFSLSVRLTAYPLSPSLIRSLMASVSWISPPLPGLVLSKASNILAGIIYLAAMARLEGASLGDGFSIKFSISTTPLLGSSLGFIIPYLCTCSMGTRLVPITKQDLSFSYCLTILLKRHSFSVE